MGVAVPVAAMTVVTAEEVKAEVVTAEEVKEGLAMVGVAMAAVVMAAAVMAEAPMVAEAYDALAARAASGCATPWPARRSLLRRACSMDSARAGAASCYKASGARPRERFELIAHVPEQQCNSTRLA
jgi:hypothetical protein